MSDIILIALSIGLFALCAACVRGCERLQGDRP